MRKEVFKIDEKEYQFLQKVRNLKAKGFTEEDILQLDRLKEISKEVKQKERLIQTEQYEIQIKIKQREIDFKKRELEKSESLEKHEAFTDGKKPLFMLESDIDKLEFEIKGYKELSKLAKEEYAKEEKNAT